MKTLYSNKVTAPEVYTWAWAGGGGGGVPPSQLFFYGGAPHKAEK